MLRLGRWGVQKGFQVGVFTGCSGWVVRGFSGWVFIGFSEGTNPVSMGIFSLINRFLSLFDGYV